MIPSTAKTGFKYATLQHDMLEVKGQAGQRSEVPGGEGGTLQTPRSRPAGLHMRVSESNTEKLEGQVDGSLL